MTGHLTLNNGGIRGVNFIHYPLGTIIRVGYSELTLKSLHAVQHNQDTFLPNIAGKWRVYRRYARGVELKRISHGEWCIAYQWRRGHPLPGANANRWESWRIFSVYPLRFSSNLEAKDFLFNVLKDATFKNVTGRKPSASVYNVGALSHVVKRGSKPKERKT